MTENGVETREVDMKTFFLIIALCVSQAACVSQSHVAREANVLLSFSDLANEITVGVETMDTTDADVLPNDMPMGTP